MKTLWQEKLYVILKIGYLIENLPTSIDSGRSAQAYLS